MIKVIDNRTDEVLSDIQADDKVLEAVHVEDAESKEETFDFTVVGDYEGLSARNRVLIQDDDKKWREFIIENIDEIDDEREIFTNASYLEDLENGRPIAPTREEQLTVSQWVDFATTGTGWEVGTVEYGGFRTISWTGYNSPYEVLTIIANRFEMTLRFRVETDFNRVTHRYVDMVHVNHLFDGKEVVRGKDLEEFKRTENTENLATALIALGPQRQGDDGEDLPRIIETIVDDEANERFNKPGTYIWKLYEPSTQDDELTRDRLRTLARTELNKRKDVEIDYEISAVNLEQNFGHEKVRIFDKIRIKDDELNRFAEAKTKRITRNLLDDTDRQFTFGDIVEYDQEDLVEYFNSIMAGLQKRLDNSVSNAENIRIDIENKLNYYERKIEKSETPPTEPLEGDLWLDTSGNAGVLYRFENGGWIKSSVTEASEIGAITREQAIYESLINTKESLHVKHIELQNTVYDLLNNEYFVDAALKQEVQRWLDKVNGVFTEIESELDAMTFDTATIGRLVDVQGLIVEYRNNVHYLSRAILLAQQAINEYFALLQSQYSEEKFNDAMNQVADTFNLEFVDGQLIGNVVLEQTLDNVKKDLQEQLNEAKKTLDGQDAAADKKITNISQKLEILEGNISAKLEQTDIDPLNDKIVEHTNDLKANAQSIRSLIDKSQLQGNEITKWSNHTSSNAEELARTISRVSGNENELKQAQLDIQANANGLTERVTKSDYVSDQNNIVKRFEGTAAERKLLADQISQRVKSSELTQAIDGIEVGSVNLIPDSNLPDTIDSWNASGSNVKIYDSHTTEGLTDFLWVNNLNADARGIIATNSPVLTEKIQQGFTYTVTFETAHRVNVDEEMSYVYLINETPNTSNQWISGDQKPLTNIGGNGYNGEPIYKHEMTVVAEFTGYAHIRFGTRAIDGGNNARFYLRKPQIVQGNKSVPYNQSPEDSDIGEVLTRIEKNETLLEQNDKSISLKANTKDINKSHETLAYALSELTVSSSSGFNFKYDSNGLITSYSVGPDGIKLDGSKIDIQASEELSLAVGQAQAGNTTNRNMIGYTDFWNNPDAFFSTHDISNNDASAADSLMLNPAFGKGWIRLQRKNGALLYIWTRSWGGDYPTNFFTVAAGDTYTFSVLYATNWNNPPNYVYMRRNSDNSQKRLDINGGSDVERHRYKIGEINGRTVYRMTYTFKAPWSANDVFIFFGLSNSAEAAAGFYVSEWKMEEGPVATGYYEELRGDSIISQINADDNSMRISAEKLSIDASQLKIDAANINLVGDVEMVNGRTVIRDLTADKITGGTIRGANGNMQIDLNNNDIDFNGSATINFRDENNIFRMYADSSTTDTRQIIHALGTSKAPDGYNQMFLGGGHYDLDGTVKANQVGFAGMKLGGNKTVLAGTKVLVASGGDESRDQFFEFDFTTSLSNRYAYFKPSNASDNFVIGSQNVWFHSMYTWRLNGLRFYNPSGNIKMGYDNGSGTGASWRFFEDDIWFDRGGTWSVKQAITRANDAYESINASNGLQAQIRSLAQRVSQLE